MFDLMQFVKQHRYRVRNFHDGRPVPPTRPPKHGERGRVTGFVGQDDRLDAIIGKYGYACTEDERVGWALFCRARFTLTAKLDALRRIPGVVVQQVGDIEGAGQCPPDSVPAVLEVLRPCTRALGDPAAGARLNAPRQARPRQSKPLGLESTQDPWGGAHVGADGRIDE